MRLLLILFILVFSVFWFTNNHFKTRGGKEHFEGIIYYKIIFVPKSNNKKYIDYHRQKYGDRIALYINKDGNLRREYPRSGDQGFDFFLYDPDSNKNYTKWRHLDTIYTWNADVNSLRLTGEKDLEKTIIM